MLEYKLNKKSIIASRIDSFIMVLLFLGVFLLPLYHAPSLERLIRLKPSNLLLIVGSLLAVIMHPKRFINMVVKYKALPVFIILNALCFGLSILFKAGGAFTPDQALRGFMTLVWIGIGIMSALTLMVMIDNEDRLVLLIKAVILSCTFFSVVGLYQYIGYLLGFQTGQRYTELIWLIPRLSSTSLEPLYFANFLVVYTPISLICFLSRRDLFKPWLFGIFVGVQLLAMLLTFSAGGWFSLAIGGIIPLFLIKNKPDKRRIISLGAIILAIIIFLILINQFIYPDLVYGFKGTVSKIASVKDVKTNYARMASTNNIGVEYLEYDIPNRLKPDTTYKGSITLKNTGTLTWEKIGMVPVVISHKWIDSNGESIPGYPITRIKQDIKTGEEAVISIMLKTPDLIGSFTLEIDAEQYNVSKFSLLGAPVLNVPVELDEKAKVPSSFIVENPPVGESTVAHNKDNLNEYYPNNFSSLDRTWLIVAGLNMFKVSPFTGLGLGRSGYLYNDYRPSYAQNKDYIASINNQYIEVLAETGIIGFAAFAFLLYFLLRKAAAMARNAEPNTLNLILLGFVGGFIGLGLQANLFSGLCTLNYIWIAIGLLLTLNEIHMKKSVN